MGPIWLLAHCILGKFFGVVCHCFPPPLDVPTFATTCLCVGSDARDPSSERWNFRGRERCPVVILPKFRLPRKFRDLLHTSTTWDRRLYFPSEGRRAGDFFALKIRRLQPGLNPRTWVPKPSTLPLDHRSPVYSEVGVNKILSFRKLNVYFLILAEFYIRDLNIILLCICRQPLWSSGQSFWLQIQRSRVRSPVLPDFLSSSGSGTGFTQPREPREVN